MVATRRDLGAPRLPATMRAVVQRRYGGGDTLGVEMLSVPAIADDEVLVRVAAAGVDRGVWHLTTGRPWLVRLMGFGWRRPKQPVPGLDLAGRVVAVGAALAASRVVGKAVIRIDA